VRIVCGAILGVWLGRSTRRQPPRPAIDLSYYQAHLYCMGCEPSISSAQQVKLPLVRLPCAAIDHGGGAGVSAPAGHAADVRGDPELSDVGEGSHCPRLCCVIVLNLWWSSAGPGARNPEMVLLKLPAGAAAGAVQATLQQTGRVRKAARP
jgi:hypothetical protein